MEASECRPDARAKFDARTHARLITQANTKHHSLHFIVDVLCPVVWEERLLRRALYLDRVTRVVWCKLQVLCVRARETEKRKIATVDSEGIIGLIQQTITLVAWPNSIRQRNAILPVLV